MNFDNKYFTGSKTDRRNFLRTVGLGLASVGIPWGDPGGGIPAQSDFETPEELPDPLKKFKNIPITDCHFHMHGTLDSIDWIYNLEKVRKACGKETVSVLATSARSEHINDNFIIAVCKAAFPSKVYAFGGLMYHYPATDPKYIDFGEQARTLTDIGFDGFKMIEGKPIVREEVGIPLDDARYDPWWEHLESDRIPLLWHVADPWSGSQPPPGIERVYRETENVLKKYPGLKVMFAHFYFVSHVLDRAADFLERHPNVNFDLTPHGLMYADFSVNPERAREFFIKYQNRIVFGTDNRGESRNFGPGAPLEYWPVHKLVAMRKFLETDEEFRGWHQDLRGIALPDDVLEKIYYKNYHRLAGSQPGLLHVDRAMEVCKRIVDTANQYGVINEIVDEARNCMHSLIRVSS